MKMTYTDIKNQFLRNIGYPGSTDTNLLADFSNNLGQRYQMVMAKLANYMTQNTTTMETVIDQQYYDYPLGIMNIEDVVIQVGNVNYPLDIINSQHNWDLLNAIQVQASAIPQFIFPRSPYLTKEQGGGFGIWPIPQQENDITFNKHYRDRDLSIADYTTGTVSVTSDDSEIVGAGGATFTAAMVGRWFQVTSETNTGQGYWYLISAFVDATHLTIVPAFVGATGSGLTYRIGQVPLIPDEGHIILADGVTSDFFGGPRKDYDSMKVWNNRFWTGDPSNQNREEGDPRIVGGMIGLVNRYANRNNERIINRRPRLNPLAYQVWATTLSST